MYSSIEREGAVLFVKGRGSQCRSYHRPQKLPLSLEMHRTLRNNAFSSLPSKSSERDSARDTQRDTSSELEPWLDYEATLYDLPKPGGLVTDSRQSCRHGLTSNATMELRGHGMCTTSMTFPEDLDTSFQCGQLDATLNSTKCNVSSIEPRANAAGVLTDTPCPSEPDETDNVLVPDCNSYDTRLDCLYGDDMETTLYTYNSDKTRSYHNAIKEKSVHSSEVQAKAFVPKKDLPLLFYPRSKKKQKKNKKVTNL